MRKKKSINKSAKSPDYKLLLIILCLLVFGVIMVYDASVVYAHDLFGGKYYFLILQSFWAVVGIVAALAASRFDYHKLEKFVFFFFIASFISLLLLALHKVVPNFLMPIYETFIPKINGAYRWIYFNPSPLPSIPVIGRIGFQPSEFAKIALSVYLAFLFSSKKKSRRTVFQLLLIIAVFGGLVVLQPDFGTALIIVGVAMLIYFISGAGLKGISLSLFALIILAIFFIGSSSYRRERLMTYLYPSKADTLSSRYQINQILIALGSGGLTGLGFGKSIQKYGYVPEVQTDSIFSIVGEEFGFLGTAFMAFLFFLLIYRSIQIVERAPDEFGRLLGTGIIGFIGFQAFLNLFAMTHLVPLTGVPLPLISYGGSSLVVNMVSLGVLLNISRQGTK